MQFTYNPTLKNGNTEPLRNWVSQFYLRNSHDLFRSYLGSTAPDDCATITEERLDQLAVEYAQQGKAHQFIAALYQKHKCQFLAEASEHGDDGLPSSEKTPRDLAIEQLQRQEAIHGIEHDDINPTKLGRFMLSLPPASTARNLVFLDCDLDPLIALDLAQQGRGFASFTRHREIAALNLLLAQIFEVPVIQHLGIEEELLQASRTGILPGCLSDLTLSDTSLFHFQRLRYEDSIPLDFLPLYQNAHSVTLLSPAQFLQRDELIQFRKTLLDQKALQTLINFPLGVYGGDYFDLPKTQAQTVWHFSFHQPSPTFRFLDSASIFKNSNTWNSKWDPNEALETITGHLSKPADQQDSFEINPDQVTAPLSMIRLIDYQENPNSTRSDVENRVKISDLFELVEDTHRFDHPRKPGLVDIFENDDFLGMWELFEPGDDEPDPQFTDDEKFHFLIHPRIHEGRLQIITDGDPHDSYREYFGLRLRPDSPETNPRILFLLLSDDDFFTQLSPFFHGTTEPGIHPTDFLNASLTLPSQQRIYDISRFIAGATSHSSSDILRKWQIHTRGINCLWILERPEDDIRHACKSALEQQKSEFSKELLSKSHSLNNTLGAIHRPITLAKKLLERNIETIKPMKHHSSQENPIEFIEKSLKRCRELASLINALTSISTKKALVSPYSIVLFIQDNKDIFSEFELDLVPPPNTEPMTRLHPEDFKTILTNIKNNARRHGGFDATPQAPKIRIFYALTRNFMELHIQNNGRELPIGFTTDMFTRAGEYQGSKGGSGMGGQEIFERMNAIGGSIEIIPVKNQNYTVDVTLKFPR